MAHKKIVVDVTPAEFACPPFSTCPAVYRTSDGKYMIVGKIADLTSGPSEIQGRVGPGEIAIEVPSGLIDGIER